MERRGSAAMKQLIARWARKVGVARTVCTLLLLALVPLRIADPRPLEEVRLRTFDLFQVLRPREQTAAPGRHRRYRRGQALRKSGNGRGRVRWWPI